MDDKKFGTNTVKITALQSKYPYLAPIRSNVYKYADVDLIIGQDSFHAIRPEKYFKSEADPNTSPVAVRLPIGWVLSGPIPTSTGFLSTCFKCNTDCRSELACQIKRWFEIESHGAYKQVGYRSAEDKRAAKKFRIKLRCRNALGRRIYHATRHLLFLFGSVNIVGKT